MGSTDRAIREKQLKMAEGIFDARKSRLKAAGIEGKQQSKDPVLRNLAADLRKARPGSRPSTKPRSTYARPPRRT